MTEESNGNTIKSAYERAMERVANLQTPSQAKRLEWRGVPEGTQLAVRFLKGEGDLAAGLKGYEKELQPYVLRGVLDVLVPNLHHRPRPICR
ncbi:MAG: hypothetical protein HW397_516 [Dehalococcoidia bacterium]|nr:hypothetical protein [Dehalococcoidia bacterium]